MLVQRTDSVRRWWETVSPGAAGLRGAFSHRVVSEARHLLRPLCMNCLHTLDTHKPMFVLHCSHALVTVWWLQNRPENLQLGLSTVAAGKLCSCFKKKKKITHVQIFRAGNEIRENR